MVAIVNYSNVGAAKKICSKALPVGAVEGAYIRAVPIDMIGAFCAL